MKVSKDLYVSLNDEGLGLVIFSNSLGKKIVVLPDEILPLIEALQSEHAAQQSVQATGQQSRRKKVVFKDVSRVGSPRA